MEKSKKKLKTVPVDKKLYTMTIKDKTDSLSFELGIGLTPRNENFLILLLVFFLLLLVRSLMRKNTPSVDNRYTTTTTAKGIVYNYKLVK